MKITKYIIAAGASVMVLASCGKEFLETSPTSALATGNVFKNITYVEYAVQGLVYNMQDQMGAFDGECGEQYIISCYENYTSQTFSYTKMAPGWNIIMNGNYFSNPTKYYNQYAWAYYYKLIANANAIIVNVDACPDGTPAQRGYFKAQALTFRAWAYTRLLALFAVRWKDSNNGEEDGVVLRLDEGTGGCPIASQADVYQQIYDDVDEAVTLFDAAEAVGVVRPAGQVWLPNANTAYAVKAIAALTREDWPVAKEAAVKAQEGISLMTNADYKAGFCDPTSEWIFGSASVNETTDNMWYMTFSTQFACNGYYAKAAPYGTGACDYDLLKTIPDNDVRKGLFITPDKFSPSYDWTKAAVMDQTFAQIKDANLLNEVYTYIDNNTPAVAATAGCGAYEAGAIFLGSQLKFWCKALPGYASVPYIRASEMVLIEAEACTHIANGDAQAQAALVKLNATSGRQPGYTCTKTGNDLFEEIVKYRKLELWGEGRDWSDHKRWKRAINRTSIANGGNHHASTAVSILPDDPKKNNWTWAIPEIETLYNPALKDTEE